ncbi:MAG TPA: CDP-alcohol phosphatidyltransferase family protein [Myxococcales bacterium]|nr:CDP-alcohol phosphatidyltransferase family protein [Myxococcales bacterium]
MIDNAFRALLPRFVAPVLALYARLGVTPNQVSALGFVIAICASTAVALDFWGLALALWWLSRLADGTDGLWARQSGLESDFGAYLDIVLDMAAYGAMVLGFAYAAPEFQLRWMAMLFLYVVCITSALALGMQEAKQAMAPRDDRGLRLGAGLAEGGETGIAYSLFLLLPDYLWLSTGVWVVVLATTVLARTLLAFRTLGYVDSAEASRPADATDESRL